MAKKTEAFLVCFSLISFIIFIFSSKIIQKPEPVSSQQDYDDLRFTYAYRQFIEPPNFNVLNNPELYKIRNQLIDCALQIPIESLPQLETYESIKIASCSSHEYHPIRRNQHIGLFLYCLGKRNDVNQFLDMFLSYGISFFRY